MTDRITKVEQVAYHRNGVSGEPFWAIRFRDGAQSMLGIVFAPDDYDVDRERFPAKPGLSGSMPRVAVLDLDLLPNITFGENSWRGDHYASQLYAAIEANVHAPVAVQLPYAPENGPMFGLKDVSGQPDN